MNFQKKLTENKRKVDEKINEYTIKFHLKLNHKNPLKKIQTNLFNYIQRGGKRIRAILIIMTYLLYGGNQNKRIVEISIYIEFIQAWILIHDDIMDHDNLRRGGPTFHKIYENLAKEYNFDDDKDFGNTMAILAGDLANTYAIEIIAKSKFSSKNKNNLILYLSQMLQKVMHGQLLDILISKKKNSLEKNIIEIHNFKTAKYTFELPMYSGAILAGCSDNILQKISYYAIPLGIAFQIRDDILGVFGDQKKTGKSSFSDLKEGKKTLLTLKAYEKANQEQKKILDKYIGKKNLTNSQAEQVRQIIKKTGSLKYSLQKCKKYVEEAKQALQNLPKQNKESWHFLYDLAEYIIIREL